jgi:tetratricopeptide (TPR) repeat protein
VSLVVVTQPDRRVAIAGLALLVSVLAVPRPVGTQSPVRRVPGFDVTQKWIQIARSHRVGEIDSAVLTAIVNSQTEPSGRLLSGDLGEVLYGLGAVKALLRAVAAGQSEIQTRNGSLKRGDLVPLLGLSETVDGFPDRASLNDPDSRQWRAITDAMIAVAILHTDVAMTPPERWGRFRPPSGVSIVDGRTSQGLDVRFHYGIARAAVDIALPSSKGGTFGRLWYRATAADLQYTRNYLALMPHLEHAQVALPDDARMFLFGGAAFENMAAPAVQSVIRESGNVVKLAQSPELLLKAEPLLRRALELDPASADAQVRLGRVLYLRGHDQDAYSTLIKAETAGSTPMSKYFAALFAGRALERMAEHANARLAYERARAQFPDAQSPRMALAEMDLRAGDQPAARENLGTLFPKPDGQVAPDPWWTYDVWLALDARDLMAQVRAARASANR